MKSVTKLMRVPSWAKSHGHDPLSRCSATMTRLAANSKSAWVTPLGQLMRVTSAWVRTPSPKWTGAPVSTCFWTSSPARTSISPPTPNALMRWSPAAAWGAGPDLLPAVAGVGLRDEPDRRAVLHPDEIEQAVAGQVVGGEDLRVDPRVERREPRSLVGQPHPGAGGARREHVQGPVVVEVGEQQAVRAGGGPRGEPVPGRDLGGRPGGAVPASPPQPAVRVEQCEVEPAVGVEVADREADRRRRPLQGRGRVEPSRLAVLEQVHHAVAVEQRRVGVAVAVEVSPAEVPEGGHAGKRALLPPGAVGVVPQDRGRPGGGTDDDVEVPVHLGIGGPDPPGIERRGGRDRAGGIGARGVGRRRRRLGEAVALLVPHPQAKPPRSGQGEVHPVVAVPVEGEHAVAGRQRTRRPRGKRKAGAVRAAETARRLPVRGEDHRGLLAPRDHRDHRLVAGDAGTEGLGDVGEGLVPGRGGGGGRRQHEKAHQRLGDGLGADADPGLVLPERGQAHEDVAQELSRGPGSAPVRLRERRRQPL